MKSAVDTYLSSIAPLNKLELERIRTIVKEEVPDATEVVSYGMPGFTYKQKYLVGYAAFKDHLSFFPTSGPIEALQKELAGFKTSRGTIQFTPKNTIPKQVIKRLVAYRIAQIDASQ